MCEIDEIIKALCGLEMLHLLGLEELGLTDKDVRTLKAILVSKLKTYIFLFNPRELPKDIQNELSHV